MANLLFSGIALIGLFFFVSFNHSNYFKDAFVFWENAAINSPRDADSQLHYGKQLYAAGDKTGAEMYILKSQALKPEIKRANAGLGAIYAERGEFQKAEQYYKAELKTDTSYIDDIKGLGFVEVNLKNDSEAIFYLEKTLSLDSTEKSVNSNLALLYFNHQNYNEAKRLWERLLILYPSDLLVNQSLAILYSRMKDFEKAIFYGQQEEKLGGKMPDGFMDDMSRRLAEQAQK